MLQFPTSNKDKVVRFNLGLPQSYPMIFAPIVLVPKKKNVNCSSLPMFVVGCVFLGNKGVGNVTSRKNVFR